MRFRTRLGLTALETRDVPDGNPGEILPPPPPPTDPGTYAPPPYDPNAGSGPSGDPIGGGETYVAPPPPPPNP